jgi:hypothetical protein
MTERTSDEDDMADYTDDHRDEPTGSETSTREIAPDVDTPDQGPPD